MKNKKLLSILIVLVFIFTPIGPKFGYASAQAEKASAIQLIEIIKREISLLQMLISNMITQRGISSPSYIAMKLSDNTVLVEKNSQRSYPTASIAKLMSAIIATENIEKDQRIVLTQEMLRPYGGSPALFQGRSITAKDLINASLIQSTNDASEALAFFLGKENFIALMNRKAKEIGMSNTIFYDAHGLNPANRSTPQDLAQLLVYANEKHPELLATTRNNDFWMSGPTGEPLKFQNVNNFYPLSSFVGGKTGYLPEARQTIASIFNVGGEAVAIVALYSENRQADIFSILRSIQSRQ